MNIKNLSKEYIDETGFRINLLDKINFEIEKGKITSILAPTGSGKSTLLKIISGLENSSSGEIDKNDFEKIIFIPTKSSSFTWLNVKDNIKFPEKNISEKRVSEIIEQVGLDGYEKHFPHNNSGGFRFRIALGRALAAEPSLLILDEPFNGMNSASKNEIYDLLISICDKATATILLGTTNITEAIYLSSKILVMKKNPGQISKEIFINPPVKRDINLLNSTYFHETRDLIERSLKLIESQRLFNFSI